MYSFLGCVRVPAYPFTPMFIRPVANTHIYILWRYSIFHAIRAQLIPKSKSKMTENEGESVWSNERTRTNESSNLLLAVGWLVGSNRVLYAVSVSNVLFSVMTIYVGVRCACVCVSECFKQVKTTLNYCHRLTFLLSLSSMNHINCYTFVVFVCAGIFWIKFSCFVVHCCAFRFYFASFSIFQCVREKEHFLPHISF